MTKAALFLSRLMRLFFILRALYFSEKVKEYFSVPLVTAARRVYIKDAESPLSRAESERGSVYVTLINSERCSAALRCGGRCVWQI